MIHRKKKNFFLIEINYFTEGQGYNTLVRISW